MAPQKKLTEYERKRLENIRRNDEMMAALKIHSKVSQLSSAPSKCQRFGTSKSYKLEPEKKIKKETPVVMRQSLRTRGMPPDSKGLDDDFVDPPERNNKSCSPSPPKPSPHFMGPIRISYSGTRSDQALLHTILSIGKKPQVGVSTGGKFDRENKVAKQDKSDAVLEDLVKNEDPVHGVKMETRELGGDESVEEKKIDEVLSDLVKGVVTSESSDSGIKVEKRVCESCVDLWSMSLKVENIARVVPGRIMVVKFFPCEEVKMIVAGNKLGNIGFWNVDGNKEEGDGIYLYSPHTAPISGILFQQSCLSKIYTSCYDGFIRVMDAEKEVFDLVYSGDDALFSLSQRPNDMKSLYFGEGHGGLNVLDERTGNLSSQWKLHENRINTIDFSLQNDHIMATSSTDGTACLWDLRSVSANKPKSLKIVSHNRAVHSAYFSPSAKFLATTSFDNTIGILSGVDYEETSMIHHYNQTGRWISSFRAIWGWDDAYVFVGNMKRGVDVISPAQREQITTLQSPHLTAIPCRFAVHPNKVGMLAGATSAGQVYIWTS